MEENKQIYLEDQLDKFFKVGVRAGYEMGRELALFDMLFILIVINVLLWVL